MQKYKPVSISRYSFAFCRYSLAAMVWIAFWNHSSVMLAVVGSIFLLSALLRVKRAPMIWLYDHTFQRLHKCEEQIVNEDAIFFAHLAGLLFTAVCLLSVQLIHSASAWYIVLGFAGLKTISAFGFCPASKLYECSINGNCCVKKK